MLSFLYFKGLFTLITHRYVKPHLSSWPLKYPDMQTFVVCCSFEKLAAGISAQIPAQWSRELFCLFCSLHRKIRCERLSNRNSVQTTHQPQTTKHQTPNRNKHDAAAASSPVDITQCRCSVRQVQNLYVTVVIT